MHHSSGVCLTRASYTINGVHGWGQLGGEGPMWVRSGPDYLIGFK
jgi:hypothetical protein